MICILLTRIVKMFLLRSFSIVSFKVAIFQVYLQNKKIVNLIRFFCNLFPLKEKYSIFTIKDCKRFDIVIESRINKRGLEPIFLINIKKMRF